MEELNTLKIPSNCEFYKQQTCKKYKRINHYLKDYFPNFNTDSHLYDDISDNANLNLISVQQLIETKDELSYYSIRVPIIAREVTEKYKEVWSCKTEEEATLLVSVLNDFRYYWIPITSEGNIYYEKVYL
jgi:hypothetical protein